MAAPSIAWVATTPGVRVDRDVCHTGFQVPQLVVSGSVTTLPADAPASLGLTVEGTPDGAQLIICGFAAKSIISAGESADEKTWVLPASDAADASLIPPPGFVGQMKLDVVLVNPDKSVADRRTLQLRWRPQINAALGIPWARDKKDNGETEIETQLEEGRRLQAAGNLPLARGIFLRHAQTGHPRAAFLYADSYDPIALAKRQLLLPESDASVARIWYRKASEWGSQEASTRLERLATW
jgi:hypothetical protein